MSRVTACLFPEVLPHPAKQTFTCLTVETESLDDCLGTLGTWFSLKVPCAQQWMDLEGLGCC